MAKQEGWEAVLPSFPPGALLKDGVHCRPSSGSFWKKCPGSDKKTVSQGRRMEPSLETHRNLTGGRAADPPTPVGMLSLPSSLRGCVGTRKNEGSRAVTE